MKRFLAFLLFLAWSSLEAETSPACFSPYSVNLVNGAYQEKSSDILLNGPMPIILERECGNSGWKLIPRSLLKENEENDSSQRLSLATEYDDEGNLILVQVTNAEKSKIFSQAKIEYFPSFCQIELHTGQRWTLNWNPTQGQLEKVILPNLAEWKYCYESHPDTNEDVLTRKEGPEGRYLINEYYAMGENQVGDDVVTIIDSDDIRIGRVKLQKAPAGVDTTPFIVARYFYDDNSTTYYDALNHKTIYRFHPNDLTLKAIEKYTTTDGAEQLYRIEKFFYKASSSGKHLISHAIQTAEGKIVSCQTYTYDAHGYIIQETIWGNLTGSCTTDIELQEEGIPLQNGTESYQTTFTYSSDGKHLLLQKVQDNGISVRYLYGPLHNMPIGKLVSKKGKIFSRYFYTYNEDGILVSSVMDDGSNENMNDREGATERHITSIILSSEPSSLGLPSIIEEKRLHLASQEEKLLKTTVNTYRQGRLVQQDVCDSNAVSRNTTATEYDNCGNAVFLQDEKGGEAFFSYDANGNKIRDFMRQSGEETTYCYDFCNRPLTIIRTTPDGKQESVRHSFDINGNKTTSEDSYGNQTHYFYDNMNRLVKIIFPSVLDEHEQPSFPIVSQQYDEANHIIAMTDPKGHVVRFQYNSRGKPVTILYPDGTKEYFTYDLDGSLHSSIDKQGIVTTYERDLLCRPIKTKQTTQEDHLLAYTEATYSPFHLLTQTDANGNSLRFSYDVSGNMSSSTNETQMGSIHKTFTYDSLGQISKAQTQFGKNETYAFLVERNADNQIIEKRIEDSQGNVLIIPEAPSTNNNISTDIFCEECSFLNERGQTVRQIMKTDKNGFTTQITCDALGRPEHLVIKNLMGMPIAEQEIRYDLAGNKVLQRDKAIKSDENAFINTTIWEYGPENHLTKMIEHAHTPFQKVTSYAFNSRGLIETIIKPDGVSLHYQYNDAGLLSSFFASDLSFAYEYQYDSLQRISKIENLSSHSISHRQYNGNNQVVAEQLANGLKVFNQYDLQGRRIKLILPDLSGIEYLYDGLFLKKIQRFSSSQKPLYHHAYHYNIEGKIIQSNLIHDLGEISYGWDRSGRSLTIDSPYWSEMIEEENYNPDGNLSHQALFDSVGSHEGWYGYDDLGQLIDEKGIFSSHFSYDSLGNRLSKNESNYQINACSQVTSADGSIYAYDVNGNLVEKRNHEQHMIYRYDALNRLIEVKQNNRFIEKYTYDAFFRRLTLCSWKWDDSLQDWQLVKSLRFIFDGDKEIGAIDEKGNMIELRVLGLGLGAEIGAAVAIELEGNTYAPIHDHRGNVCCLVNTKTRFVDECYRYSAFGEEQIYNGNGEPITVSCNPWRFSSKRNDLSTGLIYFGKRFYDPNLGRWISQDPLGAFDGPNGYIYAKNRPLSQIDLYGLFSFDCFFESAYGYYAEIVNMFQSLKEYANLYHRDSVNYPFFTALQSQLEDLGHLLMGRTLFRISGYYINPSRSGVYGKGEVYDKTRITFINGILNDQGELEEILRMISTAHGGTNIHYTYRGTQGWTVDMIHCIWVKLGILSDSSRQLAGTWKQLIHEMGGLNGGGRIIHYAHSVGATETLLAKSLMTAEELHMIRVITFGSPTIIPNEGFYDVINYSSRRDGVSGLVTFLPNPFTHVYFLIYGDYNLVLIGSHFDGYPIIDHLFDMYWNYWLNHSSQDMPGIFPTEKSA